MSDHNHDQASNGACSINRRGFLGASAGIAAAASLGQGGEVEAQTAAKGTQSTPLLKRKLGRTGVEVSILNFGTYQPDSLNRLLPLCVVSGRPVCRHRSHLRLGAGHRQVDEELTGDSQGVVPRHERHAAHAA